MPVLRRLLLLVGLCLTLMSAGALHAETWYVRADGGARGQCDGKADAAYAGHGNNKHCAFGDLRSLWDGREYGKLQWVISGGDTVIIDNTKQWRIGWDGTGANPGEEHWCWGWQGGAYGCFNPSIPPGTAEKHTRILGRNWEHCSVGNQPDKSKMSQVFGGHGVWTTLNLSSTHDVDVQCLEVTRHSQCNRQGEPRLPSNCKTDIPLDDYDGDGLYTDASTRDLLLEDLWIHGHVGRGVNGAIGGVVTANRVIISTNGSAGWDFDDGHGTASVNGVLNFNNSVIEWSGCAQEYPAVHPIPVAACYGQSDGGYGDSFGTPSTGLDVHIDRSVFRYNTQDGPDFLHVDQGRHKLSITNSMSYGNNGAQFKWGGGFTDVLLVNNLIVSNCLRLSKPFPGVPDSYDAHLHDFCRAGADVAMVLQPASRDVFDNNTIVGYEPGMFEVECSGDNCSASTLVLRNNIVMGIDNPATYNLGGQAGGPFGFYFGKPVGHVVRENNLFYGIRNFHCERSEICADPHFVGEPRFTKEADLDNFNFHLAPNSPARHAGVRIPDLKTDFDGKPRAATGNYTLGALE